MYVYFQARKRVTRKEESESESDFGDDDEDSDDDYEDSGAALKPWQKKAKERRSSRLDQVGGDSDDDDGMDDDEEGPSAAAPVVEADLEDYQKITLPRRRLGRWCNEPYFTDAVLNCYVKLFIGENEQGKRCYRLCRIVGVVTTNSYSLPPVKNHKPVSLFYNSCGWVLVTFRCR